MLAPWKKSYDQHRQHIKKQRHYFSNKSSSSQSYRFSSSHVWMWELNYKESWVSKNWCFWTVVLEKTLESPLDCKELQPVHPKGDYPGCSLEGLMLKLKLQYSGHLIQRADSFEKPWCWKRLKEWGEGDDRGWGSWMASPTQWTWVWVNSGSWWWTGKPCVLQSMGSQSWTRLSDLDELNWKTSKRGTLRPLSDVCVRRFLCPFSYFNRTLLHKSFRVDQAWSLVPKLNILLRRSWIQHRSP